MYAASSNSKDNPLIVSFAFALDLHQETSNLPQETPACLLRTSRHLRLAWDLFPFLPFYCVQLHVYAPCNSLSLN